MCKKISTTLCKCIEEERKFEETFFNLIHSLLRTITVVQVGNIGRFQSSKFGVEVSKQVFSPGIGFDFGFGPR